MGLWERRRSVRATCRARRSSLFSETSPRPLPFGSGDAGGLSHGNRLGEPDLRHIGADHVARDAGMRLALHRALDVMPLDGAVGVMRRASRMAVAMIWLRRCGAGAGEQDKHQNRGAFHLV